MTRAAVASARPHRFDSPANVAQETHRVAQRMSQGGVARLFADPAAVFIELEKFDCRAGAFAWTETDLSGDCVRIDEMTAIELHELDRYGASLRG